MKNKILVIGGTGMLGKPVVNQLVKDGNQVRVMSRSTQKVKTLFGEKVEAVAGTIEYPDTLQNALQGCNAVHLNLDSNNETIGAVNVSALAKKAGIERISLISGCTVSKETSYHPYIKSKYLAEKAVMQSGVPWQIFCPTWFMESLPLMVRKGKAFIVGKQPNPFHWVAATDYAKMVSKAFSLDEAENKRFYIHGPQSMLMSQAMYQYIETMHPEIKKVDSMPITVTKFMGFIMGKKSLRQVASLYGYFEKVGEKGEPGEANKLLGKPSTSLAAWLKDKKQNLK